MGNQLVSITPSQIFPVEHYLRDHNELKFDASLGSTRFLKVARAHSQEGLIVIKVFAIHDPTLPLAPYKDRLEDIRAKLSNAVNCLPFQKIVLTEKAGLIMREYVKYSLYDRISTRPFLTTIEKKWITFQVLYALYQCHKVGVCHGDIKLENITITSWNWVLLVDFASFKPTFLPEDNPADYSYFFDTSRRRTCYIAPERFIKSMATDNNPIFYENTCNYSDLTPAMDIFSAGCALLELWNELHAPFDLSQLLTYRTCDYSPTKHLEHISDPTLRNLLASMIQREPSLRKSAEVYLSEERGRLFPEHFYSFLQSYMLIYSASPILSADEKVVRLKKDIGSVFRFLGGEREVEEDVEEDRAEKCDDKEKKVNTTTSGMNSDNDGLVIIVSLVTSCIRGLHDSNSKIKSLEILLELATHANEEIILDRILPYLLYLAKDHVARVRIHALATTTSALNLIQRTPRSDVHIFPEYVLPGLAHLAHDPSTSVRAAYARHVATLAEMAVRFLDQTQVQPQSQLQQQQKEGEGEGEGKDDVDGGGVVLVVEGGAGGGSTGNLYTGKNAASPRLNYDIELQTLHEMFQQTIITLLADSPSIVKQTLMDSGITKLCVFFGKQKANDLLLSHIITFLNDKEDKELRGTFFECIVGVAAYIGWHCSSILTPLLLQGLCDSCEFVATKAVRAMSSLTELGLLNKPALCELAAETCGFLVHPNLWIRHAAAGFLSTAAAALSLLDVQCKIMPHLVAYINYPLIQIEKPELLLESLHAPIPRTVFDSVVKEPEINVLLETLEHRKQTRDIIAKGQVPTSEFTLEMHQNLKNLFRRLEANGMTEEVENHLLRLSPQLVKIHKQKLKVIKPNDGRIELNSLKTTVRSHVYHLGDARTKQDVLTQKQSESTSSGGPPSSSRSTSSRPSSPTLEQRVTLPFVIANNEPTNNMSLHERSYIQYRTAKCRVDLWSLIGRQQDHYLEAQKSREWAEAAVWQPSLPPPGWRLRGALVAHLHEHRAPITRLLPLGAGTALFASAGRDGCVRVWDSARMEGRNIANRSKMHYRFPDGGNIIGMAVCEEGKSLAAASHTGSIQVLQVDVGSSKLHPVHSRQLSPSTDGCVVDLHYLDSGAHSVLVYATLYGSLVGWDLRSPVEAWRLENGLKPGVITTFCLDSHHSWLALGTSTGEHSVWDLRFRLKSATFQHPHDCKIRKVVSHPTEHSLILSSSASNHNEISIWNLETSSRQKVLWGSLTPPLSKNFGVSHSVCAMQAGCIDRSGFLLAGGTDKMIRFWDLESPTDSYIAVPAPGDAPIPQLTYKSRLIDGTSVIHEVADPPTSTRMMGGVGVGAGRSGDEQPRPGPEPPAAGHRDCITDIALVKASQCFLVSASRDGVIKVWK